MPERDEDFDTLAAIRGAPLAPQWVPMRVELIREDSGHGRLWKGRESDFPWYGSGVLILRPRVLPVLRDVLDEYGELLPLTSDDGPLWLFNLTNIVDGLDEARSEVVKFDDTVMRIDKAVFFAPRIRGIELFKVKQKPHSPLFFSEAFVERVCGARLVGLDFEQVWSSDEDGDA